MESVLAESHVWRTWSGSKHMCCCCCCCSRLRASPWRQRHPGREPELWELGRGEGGAGGRHVPQPGAHRPGDLAVLQQPGEEGPLPPHLHPEPGPAEGGEQDHAELSHVKNTLWTRYEHVLNTLYTYIPLIVRNAAVLNAALVRAREEGTALHSAATALCTWSLLVCVCVCVCSERHR